MEYFLKIAFFFAKNLFKTKVICNFIKSAFESDKFNSKIQECLPENVNNEFLLLFREETVNLVFDAYSELN